MKGTLRLLMSVAALLAWPLLGWADGAVRLQTGDPSCGDGSGDVYVDCLNGTVTDNRTGLVWLKNAGCIGPTTWYDAMEIVAGLADLPDGSLEAVDDCGLSDGSSPGEWRLPSMSEWEAMSGAARALGCHPPITNDSGGDCWSSACNSQGLCAFSNVMTYQYWSSTTRVDGTESVFFGMADALVGEPWGDKAADTRLAWPVRGGQ